MEEVSFFQNDTVIVTPSRFIVESKVYEIKDISSVKVGFAKSYVKIKCVIMVVGFLLMFFQPVRIIGIVVFAVTFFSLYFTQDKFCVRLKTDAGETNSLISKDRQYVEHVVKAINLAMETHYLRAFPM